MSRACGGDAGGSGEIMLFGVRVVVDMMRKSVSMNNLSQYEQPQPEEPAKVNTNNNTTTKDDVAGAGYASADDAVPNSRSHRDRERKRGPIQIADHLSLSRYFSVFQYQNNWFVCQNLFNFFFFYFFLVNFIYFHFLWSNLVLIEKSCFIYLFILNILIYGYV